MDSFNSARKIGMIRMEERQRSAPRMTDGLFPAVLEKDVSGWAFHDTPVPAPQQRRVNVSVLFKH